MLSCCSCHWYYFILIAATSRRLRNVIVTILKCIINKFHRLLLGRDAFLCYSFLGGNQIEFSITSVSLSVHCNTDLPIPPKRCIMLKIVAFCCCRVKELEHKLFPCVGIFHTEGSRIESRVVSSIAPNSGARKSPCTRRGVCDWNQGVPLVPLPTISGRIDSCGIRRFCFIWVRSITWIMSFHLSGHSSVPGYRKSVLLWGKRKNTSERIQFNLLWTERHTEIANIFCQLGI